MSLLIPFPNDLIKDTLKDVGEIYFFDGSTFFPNKCLQKKINKKYFLDDLGYNQQHDYLKVKQELITSFPTYLRWGYISHDFSIELEMHITYVLKIAQFLKKKKIEKVIFFTGSPHHIDTLLFQKACKLVRVKQFFLYASLFERLQIIQQLEGVKDRKVISVSKPRKDLSLKRVNKYIKNVKLQKFPTGRKGSGTNKTWKTSYLFSIVLAFLYKLKFIFRKHDNFTLAREYSLFNLYKIIRDQNIFLRKYKKLSLNNDQVYSSLTSKIPKIIVAAHFQPEATSFPEGEDYYSHITIIRKLRSLGYKDKIYYKEHPASQNYADHIVGLNRVGIERNSKYIDELEKLGCILLNFNFPISYKKKFVSKFVPITINGSICLERALMGYSTIYCGNANWKGLPGTIHINDIKDLNITILKMTKKNENIKKRAKKFLVNLLANTISNLTGIGTGIKMNDPKLIKTFESEFKEIFLASK